VAKGKLSNFKRKKAKPFGKKKPAAKKPKSKK
jgi:hypothetical protein